MLSIDERTVSPEVHVFPVMANWYCERCRKYIASAEIVSGRRHEDCGGKVVWKEYVLESCPPWYRQVTAMAIPMRSRQPAA